MIPVGFIRRWTSSLPTRNRGTSWIPRFQNTRSFRRHKTGDRDDQDFISLAAIATMSGKQACRWRRRIDSEREHVFNSAGRPTASPLNDRACPREAAAEHDHQDVIAAFDSPGAVRLIERNRYSGSGGVAVAVQIDKHFVSRNAQPIRDRLHDPEIRLMRNNASD